MANEIQCGANLIVTKGGATVSGSGSMALNLAGAEMIASVQTQSTAATSISFGGCDQTQAILIRNMDETTTISIYLDSGATQLISAIPGGGTIFLMGSTLFTLWGKATNGTANLFVIAVEN